MDSATLYPSGAITSVRVYSPSARFLISCGFEPEIHVSTMESSESVRVNLAPGSSLPVVMSRLEMVKSCFSSGSDGVAFIGASYITTLPPVTVPSSTVKVMDSATLYPSGAVTSVRVYSPSARFLISCGVFVDTQLSISSPASSVSVSSAPASSLPFVISRLEITKLWSSSGVGGVGVSPSG